MEGLVRLHMSTGNNAAAAAVTKEVVGARMSWLATGGGGVMDPTTLACMGRLATLRRRLHEHELAVALGRTVLDGWEKQPGVPPAVVSRAMLELGLSYEALGGAEQDALVLYRQAESLLEAGLGAAHPETQRAAQRVRELAAAVAALATPTPSPRKLSSVTATMTKVCDRNGLPLPLCVAVCVHGRLLAYHDESPHSLLHQRQVAHSPAKAVQQMARASMSSSHDVDSPPQHQHQHQQQHQQQQQQRQQQHPDAEAQLAKIRRSKFRRKKG
jgi:hypothetical protein